MLTSMENADSADSSAPVPARTATHDGQRAAKPITVTIHGAARSPIADAYLAVTARALQELGALLRQGEAGPR